MSVRNEYGRSADALLVAVDGVAAYFECEAPEGPIEIFEGPLEPGMHHVDAVFNFGPGRVGKNPHALRVKAGKDMSLVVTIGRDEHERPAADFALEKDTALKAP